MTPLSAESSCWCFLQRLRKFTILNWPRQHFLLPFVYVYVPLSPLGCAMIVASPRPNRLGSQPFWFSYPLGRSMPACKTRCMSCVSKVCFVLCFFCVGIVYSPLAQAVDPAVVDSCPATKHPVYRRIPVTRPLSLIKEDVLSLDAFVTFFHTFASNTYGCHKNWLLDY